MPHDKSPLRYPGGKSKAISKIVPHIPLTIHEYREPFIGGGSVFLAVKQAFGDRIQSYWINDLNVDLYYFWTYVQKDIHALADEVERIKNNTSNGRELFKTLTQTNQDLTEFERAVRFFVLNRITFSGTVDSGGYSQHAFEHRFTDSSIDRLRKLGAHLSSTLVTNGDYETLIRQDGEGVFIFLDPPYLSATKSKLYGVKGNLHLDFDHERFAKIMRECPHQWLITYDDSPKIRELFSFATIVEWTLQYGMNNYKQTSAAEGQELMIKNY